MIKPIANASAPTMKTPCLLVAYEVHTHLFLSSLTSIVLRGLFVVLLREYFREYLSDEVRARSVRVPVELPERGW
jgi:hypothetical protein